MAGRAGLRLRRLVRLARWARWSSVAAWGLAAALAGVILDMPMHARLPARGGPVVPFDPAMRNPLAPSPRQGQPSPSKKNDDKMIEYQPWEVVPT
jgi:hypothetical protein